MGDGTVKHVYSSVDIGTDSIKVIVCELYKNKLHLLAASSVKSKGIKKGLITDVEEASDSLKKAFNEINEILGIKIKKVIASVPSYFAEFTMVKGQIQITNENKIVNSADITAVIQEAMKAKLAVNQELVTALPIDFSLDEQENIKDPKGLTGSILGVRAVMLTTPKKNIYSVVSLLENIGVEVMDISMNSIGDIYAFRNKDIDQKIGSVINIGSETTTVSLYNKGIVVKNSIIQMGGKNIDQDIAYIYKLDAKIACRIKEKFALAHKRYASVNDIYEVTNLEGETIRMNQYEVSEIIMSRIEEILTLAKKEITVLTNKPIDYIIITGGTSNMAHFEYIVEEVLGKIASIGSVRIVGMRNNKFSSCIGNIVYFINKLKLKGKDYTMISSADSEILSTIQKNGNGTSNASMLGMLFGYFFGE